MKQFKLSKWRVKDLHCLEFFIPKQYKQYLSEYNSILELPIEDIEAFFRYSDLWELTRELTDYPQKDDWFNILVQAKRWRGIHIWMYEEGILDGSVPYSVLLEDMPKCVVDFLSKEMFQWIDKERIQRVYKEYILNL